MSKNYKYLIGFGVLGVLAYVFIIKKSKNPLALKLMDDDTTLTAVSNLNVCKKGEIPCKNNNTKCYDPNSNYYVDPCKVVTENFS